MTQSNIESIRTLVTGLAAQMGDHQAITDSEPLFTSGRLDSFTMMQLVMQLETQFGIDFAKLEFDVALVDSLQAIAELVASS